MKYLLDSNIVVAAIKGRLPVAVKLSAMRPGDIAVSIVAKMVGHMGGTLVMSNSSTGGLVATIRLQQASDARTGSMLKKKR